MPGNGQKYQRTAEKLDIPQDMTDEPPETPGLVDTPVLEEKPKETRSRWPKSGRVIHRTCNTASQLGSKGRNLYAMTELFCPQERRPFPVTEFDWYIDGVAAGPVA